MSVKKVIAGCCIAGAAILCAGMATEDDGLHWFNDIDPQTLHSITSPDFWLEIVRQPGDQLSLF